MSASVRLGVRRALPVLLAVGLAAAVLHGLYGAWQAVYEGTGSDYVAFATGGRLVVAGDHCLYCLGAQADAQAGLLGYRPEGAGFPHTFANAPLAAAAVGPLATLPLADGLRLFVVLLLAASAGAGALAVRLVDADLGRRVALVVAVAVMTTLPGVQGLVLAQWDPLLLAALLGGCLLLRGGRDVEAGLLLATLWAKPQTCLLLVPALLSARSWRAAAATVAGGALWWGSGVVLAGGAGFPLDLARLLASGQAGEGTVTAGLPSLVGFTEAGDRGVLLAGVAAIGAGLLALVVMRGRLRHDPQAAVAVGVALSMLTAAHVFSDDLLLLAPLLLLLAVHRSAAAALVACAGLDTAYWLDGVLWLHGPRALEALVTLGLVGVALASAAPATGGSARETGAPRATAPGSVAWRAATHAS